MLYVIESICCTLVFLVDVGILVELEFCEGGFKSWVSLRLQLLLLNSGLRACDRVFTVQMI